MNNTLIKSAPPMAPPGCPDLAFSTIAADNTRNVLDALLIIFGFIGKINLSVKSDLINGKLKVCLISREYPTETGWGGIGTYTYNLAHGLVLLGHHVHVIAQSLDIDKECIDECFDYTARLNHKRIVCHHQKESGNV